MEHLKETKKKKRFANAVLFNARHPTGLPQENKNNHFSSFFPFPSSYALPTKSTEVMIMPEQGTKMYVDAVLKTHERVVQVNVKEVLVP